MKKLLFNENIEKSSILITYNDICEALKKHLHLSNPRCVIADLERIDLADNYTSLHHHNEYEIIYIEDGELLINVENNTYSLSSGDFILIPPHTPHNIIKMISSNKKIIIMIFAESYLKKFNTENSDITAIFEKIKISNNHKLQIREAFKNRITSSISLLQELFHSKEYGDDILFDATFASLLVRMNKGVNFYDVDNFYKKYGILFKKINTFIEANLQHKILIRDISKHVGISESRLSHIYKEQLGISILQYIINKRLTIARDMLKIGLSINEVCAKCGFPDYSLFSKTFKRKFGISPKLYQKKYFSHQ